MACAVQLAIGADLHGCMRKYTLTEDPTLNHDHVACFMWILDHVSPLHRGQATAAGHVGMHNTHNLGVCIA